MTPATDPAARAAAEALDHAAIAACGARTAARRAALLDGPGSARARRRAALWAGAGIFAAGLVVGAALARGLGL